MPRQSCAPSARIRFFGLLIALAVVVVFARTAGFDFVDFDDRMYVQDNPHIGQGLTLEGLAWAFTAAYAANWHPLTWISHMIDIEAFGFWPGGHHLVSLVLHLAATLVLLAALVRMTGALWPSALTAFVFAVHPLHVESVAWIAERKDVLCALFWMLCLWAWGRYGRGGGRNGYAAAFFFLILALLSKPMAVTLPLVLLILDYWPLGRSGRGWGALVVEKLPMLAACAGSVALTLWAQGRWEALGSVDDYPLATRAANALVAYGTYAVKSVLPLGLAPYYPHPGAGLPGWQVGTAAVLLAAITLVSFGLRRGRPFLLAGWLWYLGTLVPVIGIVQVGSQAMADRYAYIPLVGLTIMVAWEGQKWLVPGRLALAKAALAAYLAGMALVAFFQVGYWRDSLTLFQRMLTAGGPSAKAHHGLGLALHRQGRPQQALAHFDQALALDPADARIRNDLGLVLLSLGLIRPAEEQFRHALAIDPRHVSAVNNLGVALVRQQRLEEAIRCFEQALERAPLTPGAAQNLQQARQELVERGPPPD